MIHNMKKPKNYKGGDIKEPAQVTRKIDGVRAYLCPVTKTATSFNGKPLYNLEEVLDKIAEPMDCEVFCGSFDDTITIVRSSKTQKRQVRLDELFSINPIDPRLVLQEDEPLTEHDVNVWLQDQTSKGHEGLVIRTDTKWLKVKPVETYDVPITECLEGTGQFVGHLGAFMTPMGKVGTGFTHAMRKAYWEARDGLIGDTIEVSCMELTKDGKFRHPRFVRMRFDKDT